MEELRKENRRRLWNSLEMGEVKRTIVMILVVVPLVWFLGTGQMNHPEAKWFALGLLAVFFVPYLVFYLYRMVCILDRPEAYHFCEATLHRPQSSFNRRLFYFSVVIRDEEGMEFMTNTHAIFGVRNLIGPRMEDYVDRTVTMAYNKVTGMVVVIG